MIDKWKWKNFSCNISKDCDIIHHVVYKHAQPMPILCCESSDKGK